MTERSHTTIHKSLFKLLWFSIAILTIGLIPLYINHGSWGVTDFSDQEIPFLLETKRMFSTGAPWWSWNTFSGDNFIGGYSFYTVTSPFAWLVCLFPVDKIMWGVFISLYLKTFCTCIFAYLYFRKMQLGDLLGVIGGIMYGFSSFFICNLYYFHFCEPLMMFPLLLIAVEKIARKEPNCYLWMVAASFGVVFINFYFAYTSFLLAFLYYLFRARNLGSLTWSQALKTGCSIFLGILLDSFILLPSVLHIYGTGRTKLLADSNYILGYDSSHLVVALSYYVGLLRLLVSPQISDYMPYDAFIGEYNFNSCQPFITLFGMLLISIYFIRRRDWLGWILLILLVLYLSPLNGLFSFFTSPQYRRWLYGFVLLGILASLSVIKQGISLSRSDFWKYVGICIGIWALNTLLSLMACEFYLPALVIHEERYIQLSLFLINLLCLGIWVYKRNNSLLLWMIALCSTLNLAAFSYNATDIEGKMRAEWTEDIKTILHEEPYGSNDAEFFYRYDDETNYRNIGLLQNRPGIFAFHSISNRALLPFRETIYKDLDDPIFFMVEGDRASVGALMSVKEIKRYKTKLIAERPYKSGLKLIEEKPEYLRYENENYIPMGFAYDEYIFQSDLDRLTGTQDSVDVMKILVDKLLIRDEDAAELGKVLRKGNPSQSVKLDSIVQLKRLQTVRNFQGDSRGFTCTSEFDRERVLFFSVPADDGFTAYVDNQPTKIYNVNLGMSAVVVPAGKHTIRFEYFPPGLKTGLVISTAALLLYILLIVYSAKYKGKTKGK